MDGITDSGYEFEQTPGDGEGQGSLVCCRPWGHKESDRTERPKNNRTGGETREESGENRRKLRVHFENFRLYLGHGS